MKKEQLDKLINNGKKILDVKKPIKKLFKVVLWKHTGRSIIKTIESYTMDLKQDLEIIFKPVKKFNKNDLKGVDTTTLSNSVTENDPVQRGTHTLHASNKEVQASKSNDTTLKEDGFVNWFDVVNGESQRSTLQNSKCTYTDKYGNTVSLDESYESLKRDSD
tara:strand:- start:723 stop:1208 length:486 start_codon:yes stop_codon:yes gene_type:complete